LNYRKNMPLATTGRYGATAPNYNDTTLEGARGNTVHALVSGAVTLNKNPLFSAGSIALQLDYTHLDEVTKNKDRFNGVLSGVAGRCVTAEVLQNCATRDAMSIGGNFTPAWQQVFPSIDISMPLTVLYGIVGNAAAVGAGTVPEGSHLVRLGGRLEYFLGPYKHQFDVAYTTRDGKTGYVGSTKLYSGFANFRDRDYLSFTYQTAF